MICESCHERDATVHYKEIRDDKVHEMHLCEQCAEARGFGGGDKEQFSFPDLLGGMADEGTGGEGDEPGILSCGRCGLTYPEFKAKGRLGCPDCYRHFRKPLLPLVKKIHGSDRHEGKAPNRQGEAHLRIREIRMLKDRMDRAVRMEEFEEAARLRDEVRKLEERDE